MAGVLFLKYNTLFDFFTIVNEKLIAYKKASNAVFLKNGQWELHDIKTMNLEQHENIVKSDEAIWQSGLHPSVLVAAVAAPTRMSLTKLYRALIHSKGFGILNDDTFNVFMTRITKPLFALSTLALVMLILIVKISHANIHQRLIILSIVTIGLYIMQHPMFLGDQWLALLLNFLILFLGGFSLVYLRQKDA